MDDMLNKMDSMPSAGRKQGKTARMSVAQIPTTDLPPQEDSVHLDKGGRPDVMQVIDQLADDGQKSKHMEGHISKKIIDDTFLVDADNKVPDSSLAINCADHNRPAVFFS